MIFSQSKWNNGDEIRAYVSVSNSSTFSTFNAPLSNAYNQFVAPLLGAAMCAKLEALYVSKTPSPLSDPTKKDEYLLYLAQRAVAMLAMWNSFVTLNTLVDDSGFRRATSSESDGLYKYQEAELKLSFRESGFSALDALLDFLDLNVATYTDYAVAPAYLSEKTALVRDAKEVQGYYDIASSRLVYLRLAIDMKKVEDTIIAPRLGAVYAELKAALATDTPALKYTVLRAKLIPVVTLYAVSRSLLNTGRLTDKGLYFSSLASSDAPEASSPVSDAHLEQQSKQIKKEADDYWTLVTQYLAAAFEVNVSGSGRMPARDNDGKNSFWV